MDGRGGLVMAVANGTAKVHRGRLAACIGCGKLAMADSATVLRATGCPAGGVAPVLHSESIPIVIDSAVMAEAVVDCGGGREDVRLRLAPAVIVRSSGGVDADITTRLTP